MMTGTAIESRDSITAKPSEQNYIPADAADAQKSAPGANITDHIIQDETISYVRGQRKEIADNRYRIAPFNSTVGLSYYGDAGLPVTAECDFYVKQNKVHRPMQRRVQPVPQMLQDKLQPWRQALTCPVRAEASLCWHAPTFNAHSCCQRQ